MNAANAARDAPWEQGSEFHWLRFDPPEQPTEAPWQAENRYFGSGRDALRGLLVHLRQGRPGGRLWIPSYYCQEVVEALASTGIEILHYCDGPTNEKPASLPEAAHAGDAVLRVNYFGLRDKPSGGSPVTQGLQVIEDHTHDPWSRWAASSDADYCIASFRKTLPLPDGGVLWSPKGRRLPAAPLATAARSSASARKLAAMVLKSAYLEGHAVRKKDFRALVLDGESQIASGAISGMTPFTKAMLPSLPIAEWWRARKENYSLVASKLDGCPNVRLLLPSTADCCPFSVVIVLDDPAARERVRRRLIRSDVYPAILWPLTEVESPEGIPAEHVDLSRRILSIHCDMRYDTEQMERVASLVVTAIQE